MRIAQACIGVARYTAGEGQTMNVRLVERLTGAGPRYKAQQHVQGSKDY